jgi:hypothetical protein
VRAAQLKKWKRVMARAPSSSASASASIGLQFHVSVHKYIFCEKQQQRRRKKTKKKNEEERRRRSVHKIGHDFLLHEKSQSFFLTKIGFFLDQNWIFS